MTAGARLSVVVITLDEAATLGACLESVAWADEIIVLDSGSKDETGTVAKRYGARFEQAGDWPGFGPQKNRAIEKASGDWILSIDADERVSPELALEIQGVTQRNDNVAAYELPRLSSYCGRYMRHSGWWPDHVVRLFRKGRARFSDDLVHEQLLVDGDVHRLRGKLLHDSFRNLEQVLDKLNRYSTLGATQMAAAGRRGGLARALLHGAAAFMKTYLFKAGFLDGREGFMLAVSNAEGTYYRYLKLGLLQNSDR